ncbi:hypothetical protein IE077_000460 [Cardiosporidium cionae]|uniref:Hyaluronan/mRNA-binding protein domain-containing protein n=1 Tax=Cardiosporidium cionae TaxID=476202 RepID=A0ABQ7JGH7_9APIC|nr:hypothetical protein IE077_000460 [Cardiosporidium cionae]|eukprot:KAF8823117.1 hypothetical protein IE077_000460 [Cardiosporidium cionae]
MVNQSKEKPARMDRHSAGKLPAYGSSGVKGGAGKYNWGELCDNNKSPATVEPNDPMFDSEEEKKDKTKQNEIPK